MKLIFLLFTIFLVQVANAFRGSFLDEGDDFNLGQVAKKVCWSWSESLNQISKYKTLEKLVHYFESLPAEHEFSSCAKNHLKSLKALWEVTSIGNDDVCGDEKLASIERFHHQHISKIYESNEIEIPKVLRVFFFQYAARISHICATMSYSFFERRLDPSLTIEMPELDNLLEQSFNNLTLNQNFSSYNDLYLVWSLLDRLPKKIHSVLSEYLVEGSKRMVIKTQGANDFNQLRKECRHAIRPLYSQNILPALRLIDLGYYPDETLFLEQISTNNFVNRLYKLTILCETIMPIGVLEGDLNDNQIYLLKPAIAPPSGVENIATAKIIDPVPVYAQVSLPLDSLEEAVKRLNRIKSDIKSRREHIKNLIKLMSDVERSKKESYKKVKLWETKQSMGHLAEEATERAEQAELQARRNTPLKFLFRKSVGVFFGLMVCLFFVAEVVLSLTAIMSGLLIGVMNFEKTAVGVVRRRMFKADAKDWMYDPM